jgi:hypothetical protein
MDDPGISMAEITRQFGPTVPQAVFDFIGGNRSGLTLRQKRDVLATMATLYHEGVHVGRQQISADGAGPVLYLELDRLSKRIAKLEKNA